MPGPPRHGRFFHWRVLLLLAVLGGAVALYLLSRADDPRFYRFLTTPSGRLLAQVFGWQRDLGPVARADRPEAEWAPEERVVKLQWERELADEQPLHRLVLVDGSRIDGRLLAQSRKGVLFQEAAGEGGLTQSYAKERVLRVETLSRPAHAVTYRDVQLRRELPDFHFVKRAPFTVATDGAEEEIREALGELRTRYRELASTFGALVERPPVRTDLPVVFCGRERTFRAFRERYAPQSAHAVGFYVVSQDRLYLLNFDGSDGRREVTDRVLGMEKFHAQHRGGAPLDETARAQWRARTVERIRAAGRRETLATIRHEGAHQFFHTTGVHSPYRAENEWLVEGLATWCETPALGVADPQRVAELETLRARGGLPALPVLVNARRFLDVTEGVEGLYSYSWLVVDWLMQPQRREAFFRYVRWLRDPGHISEVARGNAWDLLCRETGLTEAEVMRGVLRRLDDLAAPPRGPEIASTPAAGPR